MTTPTTARAWSLALATLFAILIGVPMVGHLFVTEEDIAYLEKTEKRKAAPAPQWDGTLAGLTRLPEEFGDYYQDRIGFRTALIRLHARLTFRLFGNSPSDRVIIGKEGWLYYGPAYARRYYRNGDPFTQQELLTWQRALEGRRDWLAQHDIPYLFVLAPNKQSIYPEYFPARINRVNPDSRRTQLMSHMAQHSDVPVLDLTPILRAAKGETLLYWKNNTHWNPRGAYEGYRGIMASLSPLMPLSAPLALSDMVATPISTKGGDLTGMLGTKALTFDSFDKLERAGGWCAERLDSIVAATGKKTKSFAMECPGASGDRALMFRDSFSTSLVPYLSEHFRHVDYISSGYDQDVVEKIMASGPLDVVIEELVERSLMWAPPTPPELHRKATLGVYFQRASQVRLRLDGTGLKDKVSANDQAAVIFEEGGAELVREGKNAGWRLPSLDLTGGETGLLRLRVTSPQAGKLILVFSPERQGERNRVVPLPVQPGHNEITIPVPSPGLNKQPVLLLDSDLTRITLNGMELRVLQGK